MGGRKDGQVGLGREHRAGSVGGGGGGVGRRQGRREGSGAGCAWVRRAARRLLHNA